MKCLSWLEHRVPDQNREASSRMPPTCVRRNGLGSSLGTGSPVLPEQRATGIAPAGGGGHPAVPCGAEGGILKTSRVTWELASAWCG